MRHIRDGDPRYICSPLHTVLNTSAVLNGVPLIVGVVASAALWRQGRATKVALICGALGFITAGLSPFRLVAVNAIVPPSSVRPHVLRA